MTIRISDQALQEASVWFRRGGVCGSFGEECGEALRGVAKGGLFCVGDEEAREVGVVESLGLGHSAIMGHFLAGVIAW